MSRADNEIQLAADLVARLDLGHGRNWLSRVHPFVPFEDSSDLNTGTAILCYTVATNFDSRFWCLLGTGTICQISYTKDNVCGQNAEGAGLN